MTNIDVIGMDKILPLIPEGYRLLQPHETVAIGDKICHVSISSITKKEFKVYWLTPDTVGEIGQLKKYSGQIVIRLDSSL